MRTLAIAALLLLSLCALTDAYAQQQPQPYPQAAQPPAYPQAAPPPAGQPAPAAKQPPPPPVEEGIPSYLRLAIENISCGEVAQALPRANAEAAARGRGPVMSPEVVKGCGEALEVMKAALTLKQWSPAYEAIYAFHAKAGLVPPLDPKALAKRAAQFQQELTQTAKEATAPANMPIPQVAKRAVLGTLPVAFWFVPEFRDRIPRERARVAEDAGAVDSWPKLEAFADQMLWLAVFTREPGVAPGTRASLTPLFAAAKKGQFYEKAADWQRIEGGPSPALQIIGRKARGIAALDIAGKADAKAKVRDWAAAASMMKQAVALAPDDPKIGSKRQQIFKKIGEEREALLGQLKGAKNAKEALATFKKLDALDAATEGPGAAMPKEMKAKIQMTLEAAASGKQAEAAAALPSLNPGGVDYATEAIALLKASGRAAILAKADGQRKAKDYAAAERTLVDAAALYPGDREIAGLIAAIKAEAAAGRLDRFEAFFREGSVAAGWFAVRSDTGLVETERSALLAKHQAEIQALRVSLPLRGRITADNPFGKRVAAASATGGTWWSFRPEGDAAAASPMIDAAVVMASAPDFQPKLVKTDKAAAKTQAPPTQAPNPARQKCDQEYLAKQARIQQMEAQAKQPPQPPKCAPQQGGGDGWTGFGGESVCTPAVAPPTPQAIAAEKQALYAHGQQCAATPPWIAQAAGESQYEIEYWTVAPVAAVELRVSDAARGSAPLGKEAFSETVRHDGRSIKPVPQLGVPGEALRLPPADQLEAQITAALAPKIKGALERAARAYWQAMEGAAKAAVGPGRCEGFARLLAFEEITGEKYPGHPAWDAEVKQCTAAPAKAK